MNAKSVEHFFAKAPRGLMRGLIEAVDSWLTSLPKYIYKVVRETGQIVEFAIDSLKLIAQPPPRYLEIVRHIDFIGNESIGIIVLTGIFTGMALSYQIYLGFKLVNATNLVGPTVALGISRELGPVLTGLIIAARAGGAMAARIGTMRVTEQIDALEVMGVDPKQYLVTPRMIAAFISTPMLCAIFDFVAMLGSYFICIILLSMDEAVFWDKVQLWTEPRHIFEGLVKAAVFGAVFAVICTYKGFNTEGGARGVGEATNRGVVLSMVMIIVLDYFLSNIIAIYFGVLDQW